MWGRIDFLVCLRQVQWIIQSGCRWGDGERGRSLRTADALLAQSPLTQWAQLNMFCRKGQRKSEGNNQHRQHPQPEFSILTNVQILWNAWPTRMGRVRASQDQTDRAADKDGLCHPTRLERCVSTGALLSATFSNIDVTMSVIPFTLFSICATLCYNLKLKRTWT